MIVQARCGVNRLGSTTIHNGIDLQAYVGWVEWPNETVREV